MERHEAVDTPVGRLAIRVVGEGQPAVLWHSLFVDDRSWDRLVPLLAPERRLVLVTGPGHGTSTDPGRRYSNEDCASAARVVLDRLGIDKPVDWLGNAWGGHVGAITAATYPPVVRSLVMIGAPVAALSAFERARTYLLLGLHGVRGPSATVVDGTTKVLLSAQTRATDPAAVRLVQDCLRSADRRMLRNAIVSVSLRRTDITASLRRLTQPVLIITGAEHHGFTPAQAHDAAGLVPGAEVAVVPGASYLVPLEDPDSVARLVGDFWAERDAAAAA